MIRAAGAVLWRGGGDGPEVAVVHRPRYDDWSLPKGKLDDGEPHVLAAVREVHEETGIRGAVGSYLGTTQYDVDGRHKTVRWWAMRADEGAFVPNAEVDELRWLPVAQATALVREATPLRNWMALPADAGLLMLVRHGSAGDPARWQGADDDRPLDGKGRDQAALVARVVSAYRPTRIISAPPLRCQDTIGPLAEAVGLTVELDERVGETGAPARPQEHMVGLGVPGQTVVICSQGGVIPRVVEALLPDRAPVRARKGSAWALSVSQGRAVAADDDVLT